MSEIHKTPRYRVTVNNVSVTLTGCLATGRSLRLAFGLNLLVPLYLKVFDTVKVVALETPVIVLNGLEFLTPNFVARSKKALVRER